MIERFSDAAVAASVAPTLRAIHGAGGGTWAQQVTVQLLGLVEHVAARPPDPTEARRGALVAALDALAGNELVPATGSAEERAAGALVAAVGVRSADADAVRTELRPVLVAELDAELAVTGELMDAFRGRVRDA